MNIPVAVGDIDSEWLTGALRSQLPAGSEVQSFSVQPLGVGVGLMGLLYRVALQ